MRILRSLLFVSLYIWGVFVGAFMVSAGLAEPPYFSKRFIIAFFVILFPAAIIAVSINNKIIKIHDKIRDKEKLETKI